jgi:WD40 repeat protein
MATGTKKGMIELRETATGKVLAARSAHNQSINAVAFSSDGKLLATAGFDRMAKLWDVAKLLEQKPEK